jgi:hypothetical protein
MKKIIAGTICAVLLSFTYVQAQQDTSSANYHLKTGAEKAGKNVKKGAKDAAHEVDKTATNGAAHVKDRVYEDKVGPQGQTVYIDKHSKYYWIDEKGNKVYGDVSHLKDKPGKD